MSVDVSQIIHHVIDSIDWPALVKSIVIAAGSGAASIWAALRRSGQVRERRLAIERTKSDQQLATLIDQLEDRLREHDVKLAVLTDRGSHRNADTARHRDLEVDLLRQRLQRLERAQAGGGRAGDGNDGAADQ